MAGRIRSIKPEVLEDEVAAGLSDAAWRLWVSLWVLADDYGDVRAGEKYLAANVWQDTARDAGTPLQELIDKGRLHPYAVQGQRYVRIHAWTKHQRVDNAAKPRVPTPEEDDGTWNQGLTRQVAESRGDSRRDSATLGDSPLARRARAHSGGETTDPDHDHRPPTTDHELAAPAARPDARAVSDDPRGTRIQPTWKPKPETIEWARGQGVDAMACFEEFVEYWQTIPGARGRRANWDLTFRSRIRKLLESGHAPMLPPPDFEPESSGLAGDPVQAASVADAMATLAKAKTPRVVGDGTAGGPHG